MMRIVLWVNLELKADNILSFYELEPPPYYVTLCICVFVSEKKIGFKTTTRNHQTSGLSNLLLSNFLFGIAATNYDTGKEDD